MLIDKDYDSSTWRAMLKQATEQILNAGEDRQKILAAISSLHTIFASITGIRGDDNNPSYAAEIYVADGMAISPGLAASCLSAEMVRTVKFLRGIYAAIQQALARFPQRPIHIVDAGCGPYATLMMPFTTLFSPNQLQITVIDIHQTSIDAVKRLIDVLDVGDYFCACIQGDVASYTPPETRPFHIIVTETMQAALEREPQIAITLNLLPHLIENGFLIPQNIMVEACLTDPEKEQYQELVKKDEDGFPNTSSDFEQDRINLGSIFEMNIETGLYFAKILNGQRSNLPSVTLTIPQYPPEKDQFMLLTTVTVFGDIKVQHYESEVSWPFVLRELHQIEAGSQVSFFYTFGRKPGFRYGVVPPSFVTRQTFPEA